ncbi:MAG TPA: LLM class flavin-dependent oxidoreductase [Kouleothrix sp.]|uniref:LLM class flavin-dependent oxidoreductase n=1 Tax=Kouleothrix sp. TaxID=2779161 RepID=UPI002C77E556|nr:LLM class flavin-dependent oxidoreductase [Kouleothrix sp.]HRC77561.1 LLM class flavin-dependent oxidoreductase [Kouleothrix sp.]
MQFAVDIPNYGPANARGPSFADPHFVAELAYEAEQAGWDGFFIWDHIGAGWPVVLSDVWLMLAAVALRTASLRLGPMVTPLPRRRPWKLAREVATLDRLSRGRLTLGVGIGAGDEYSSFGEPGDDRAHGEMLDEGLAVLSGLLSGEPLSYTGAHYRVANARFLPPPAQPRVPIWVAGVWPNKKPFRRAAAWDGAFPIGRGLPETEQMPPEDLRAVAEYVRSQRPAERQAQPYDLVHAGITAGRDAAADRDLAEQYAAAGVTWWLENFNNDRGPIEEQRARIRKGPPRLS